jgi:toxin ParE1/3/4
MYKLQISPEAKNDLLEIKGYVSQELGSPQVAINLVSKFTGRIRGLAEHPEIGAPLAFIVDIQTNYCLLVCAKYLIFYRCETGIVFVSRILYSRRNYMQILFGNLPEDKES